MATPVSVKVTVSSASSTSFEVDLGPNLENDLIVIELGWRTSGTLAISGFTALGTKGTTDAWDSQWFAKIAGAGGESNPTASTTGSSTPCGAIAHIIRGADVSGGAAAAFDAIGSTAGSAGSTLDSHALTTTVNDCLILHGAVWDNTGIIADPADCNLLGGSGALASTFGIVSGVTYKATAGAIPTFTWTGSNASNTGRAWALAIKNASGGSPPVRLSDGRVWLQKLGGFSSPTAGIPDSVTGLAAIDGLNMNTVANTTAGALTIGTGQPSTSPWPLLGTSFATTQNLTADAWVGSFQSLSSEDISGDIITIPYGFGTVVDTVRVGPKGAIVVFVDNANAWAAFQILPQSKMLPNSAGVLTIKPGTTDVFDESTGIDWTQIVNIGYFHHRKSGTATNVAMYFYPSYREASVGAMLGGGASLPVTTALEAQFLSGGNLYPGAMTFQGSGQLVNRLGLQLGDGTNATYAKHTAQSYDIPATDDASWRVGASGVPIKIKASASDTIDLRSAIITSSILQPFTIDAASSLSASLLTTGLSVIGRTFSDLAGYNWTSASWTECDTVTIAGGGDLTNCSITRTTSANAALAITANGSTLDGTTIDGTGAAYALELDTGVTAITLTDCTITAGSTDKVHVLKTLTNVAAGAFVVGVHYRINTVGTTDFTAIGASANTIGVNFTATGVGSGTGTADQAVKITISGSTSLAETDVTTAGAPAWVAAPQPTLSATGLANTRYLLWNRTTSAELDNTFVAGTSYSKVISSGASSNDVLDLYAFKEGYAEARATLIYSGANASFAVDQVVDTAIDYYRTQESVTDYTTLTEYNFYSPDIYIQADDSDGENKLARLFIFYNGVLTTADGATYMRGGVTFNSAFDVVINRSVRAIAVDNVSVTHGLHFTDEDVIRVTTDDGTSWIAPPSAPGSIRYAFGVSPGQIETTGSSVITGTAQSIIDAIPSAAANATAVGARTVEGAYSEDEILKLLAAALAGQRQGIGTATETYTGLDGATVRISLTPDVNGNGTPVLDVT